MTRRTQIGLALIAAVVCAAAALTPRQVRAGRVIEWKLRDAHVLLEPARAPEQILLVAVDEAATEAFAEPLLFWHNYYAQAVERLAAAGARVVALDIVFAVPVERWAPGLDARLAGAAAAAEDRGVAVFAGTAPLARQHTERQAVPLNLLAASLGRLVDVALRADEDDFVRHVRLRTTEGLPALALAAAEAYRGAPVAEGVDEIEIRHAGPAGTVRRVSLRDLLAADDNTLRALAAGRIVLIGADLPMDRHATPYYAFRAGQPANTAGAEIHASAIATLLEGAGRRDAPGWIGFAAQTLVAFAAVLAAWRRRGWRLAAEGAILLALAFAASHIAMRTGWWLPQTGLALSAGLGAAAGLAAGRARLREAVRVYGGGAVARTVSDTGAMRPAARRVRATVVFTDARGFTAWSEHRAPEEVADGLNAYFERLAAAAALHGGEVNQISGDGMLVLFPEDGGADHAARAVAAVRVMLDGEGAGALRTSVGVHTGEVVMGAVGSGGKLEYTALGDAVNVAARLEQLNRETGTRVLLSEAARAAAGLTARQVGSVVVKGRTEAIEAWTFEEG